MSARTFPITITVPRSWVRRSPGAQAVVDPPGARRVAPLAAPRIAPLSDAELTEAHRRSSRASPATVKPTTRSGPAARARAGRGGDAAPPTSRTRRRSRRGIGALDPAHRLAQGTRTCGRTAPRPASTDWTTPRFTGSQKVPMRPAGIGSMRRCCALADQQFRNSSTTNATWKALSERTTSSTSSMRSRR
jgi:hypothetical protein